MVAAGRPGGPCLLAAAWLLERAARDATAAPATAEGEGEGAGEGGRGVRRLLGLLAALGVPHAVVARGPAEAAAAAALAPAAAVVDAAEAGSAVDRLLAAGGLAGPGEAAGPVWVVGAVGEEEGEGAAFGGKAGSSRPHREAAATALAGVAEGPARRPRDDVRRDGRDGDGDRERGRERQRDERREGRLRPAPRRRWAAPGERGGVVRVRAAELEGAEPALLVAWMAEHRARQAAEADGANGIVGEARRGGTPPGLVCGYLMKPERELDLARRGLLPLGGAGGVGFAPLCGDPAAGGVGAGIVHGGAVDVVLHKITDWLDPADRVPTAVGGETYLHPRLPPLAQRLEEFCAVTGAAMLDAPAAAWRLTDRWATCRLLQGLRAGAAVGGVQGDAAAVAVPASVLVPAAAPAADLARRLRAGRVGFPCIVKPNVACGPAAAHDMAVVTEAGGFARVGATVAFPWVVQELVPHAGDQCKVYSIGAQLSTAVRPSLDLARCAAGPCTGFNSLASFPQSAAPATSAFDARALACIADFLREATGLAVFGFDVVHDSRTGAHAVVDVNYFPSLKAAEHAGAALQRLLRERRPVCA